MRVKIRNTENTEQGRETRMKEQEKHTETEGSSKNEWAKSKKSPDRQTDVERKVGEREREGKEDGRDPGREAGRPNSAILFRLCQLSVSRETTLPFRQQLTFSARSGGQA